jgi:hypothetical protein
MSVRNRIRILEVDNYQDVENKVNDFLTNDPDVAQLVEIDYRLEYKIVIIEYYTFSGDDNGDDDDNNNQLSTMDISYVYTPYSNWMKLWNPYTVT